MLPLESDKTTSNDDTLGLILLIILGAFLILVGILFIFQSYLTITGRTTREVLKN